LMSGPTKLALKKLLRPSGTSRSATGSTTCCTGSLEGGLRLSHAIHVVKTFSPEEVVEVPEVGLVTKRLVCFQDKGFWNPLKPT